MSLTPTEIFKLYSILLADLGSVEVLNSNSFYPNSDSNSDVPLLESKSLGTRSQNIIGAINELLNEIHSAELGIKKVQSKHLEFLGDYLADPSVKENIFKLGTSVSDALINLAYTVYGNDLDNPLTLEESVRGSLGLASPQVSDYGKFIKVSPTGDYEYADGLTFAGDPDKIIVSNPAGDGIVSSSIGVSDLLTSTLISRQGSQIIHVDANHTGSLTEDGSIERPYKSLSQFNASSLGSGFVIQLAPGVYTSNVTLADDVSIIGSGIGKTTINGSISTGLGKAVIQGLTIVNNVTINGITLLRDLVINGSLTINADTKGFNVTSSVATNYGLVLNTGNCEFSLSKFETLGDFPAVRQLGGSIFLSGSSIKSSRISGYTIETFAGVTQISSTSVINSNGGPAGNFASSDSNSNNPCVLSDVFHLGDINFNTTYAYLGDFYGSGSITGSQINRRSTDTIKNSSLVSGDTLSDALDTLNTSKENPLTFDAPLSRSLDTVSIAKSSSTSDGYLSKEDWTAFNAKQDPISFQAPIVFSGGVASIPQASSTESGYLSSSNWLSFDRKLAPEDIIDNLTAGGSTKVLSAEQGKLLSENKLNKISTPVTNNLVVQDSLGNLLDAGVSASSFSDSAHDHAGVYEPIDATILREDDVVDDLASTSVTSPLSANQGKILNDTKSNKIAVPVEDNLLSMTVSGDLKDSGLATSSIALEGDTLIRGSKVVYVDSSKTGTYTPDGSYNKPFKLIQSAVDSASTYSTLLVAPGVYVEDITLSKNGLSIVGLGGSVDSSNVFIQGKFNISGTSNNTVKGVTLENNGSNATDYGLLIDGLGTSDILIEDCFITRSSSTDVAVRIEGDVAGNVTFNDVNIFGEIENSVVTIPAPKVVFKGLTTASSIRSISTGSSILIVDSSKIGSVYHLQGKVKLSNISRIIEDGSNIGISSTAPLSANNFLDLSNIDLLQDDNTYAPLFKTGDCSYFLNKVSRDPNGSTLTGSLVYRGLISDDITANYAGTAYTGAGVDSIKDHLYGIDQVLATIPSGSGGTYHDATFTGTTTVDLITSPAGSDLLLKSSVGNNATLTNSAGAGLTVLDSGNSVFSHDLTVSGNLIISGTTTTVDTQNLVVQDSIITLSKDTTVPILSGLEIKTGTGLLDTKNFLWDPTLGWVFSTGDSTKFKIWYEDNDGSGSGLDADLLDGNHGSYFLDLNNSTGILSISNGGTGSTSFTTNEIVISNGSSLVSSGKTVADFASAIHGHSSSEITYTKTGWAGVTDVSLALDDLKDSKADLLHNHNLSDITNVESLTNNEGKLLLVNDTGTSVILKSLDQAQIFIKLSSKDISQGYFDLPSVPIGAQSVSIVKAEGGNQRNKASDISGVYTQWDFEVDFDTDLGGITRVYIQDVDGHTGLSGNFVLDEVLEVTYLYLI